MSDELVGVIDIGKTHSKLTLLERATGSMAWSAECESGSVVRQGLRQLDVGEIERWLIASLRCAPNKARIRTLVPVAHGAAAALVDRTGRVLAIPDYEDASFDTVRMTYAQVRDPFSATFSPQLPLGLNLGIQLFYFQDRCSELFERVQTLLLYPQYWAWRLCGLMASEVTSLGCHSDLWLPGQNRFSPLAVLQGWTKLFPPMRRAGEVLGRVTPEVVEKTGLDPACVVLCGLHDSNASYLAQVAGLKPDVPVTVISSGTWVVIMSRGAALERLQPQRDMLANVDICGKPLCTARFMGGREYQAIAGKAAAAPDLAAIRRVIDRTALALPCFVAAGGPFAGVKGELVDVEGLPAEGRAALATLYVALMTDLLLDDLGVGGSIVIDGPLANNPIYSLLLAALRPRDAVERSSGGGTVRGAYCLVRSDFAGAADQAERDRVESVLIQGLEEYRVKWRARIPALS
jgi:sugar (pentulose or hexulose) kinase